LTVKYDEITIFRANTKNMLLECFRLFIESINSKEKSIRDFYENSKPILAFKIKDTRYNKCFYDVTNVWFDLAKGGVRIKKNASKPDVVGTKRANNMRTFRKIENLRE
jgi:hypothetical protein